jgi:predicted nuclease with TOPRIM domain
MDPAALVSIIAAGSGVAGYILKRVVDHVLGRRRVTVDEATKIRTELRNEIERKDGQLDALNKRLAGLEQELEKAERERDDKILALERYKLDVYRTLVDSGANKELVNAVLAIPERGTR